MRLFAGIAIGVLLGWTLACVCVAADDEGWFR